MSTRCAGVAAGDKRLAAYASEAVHGCIAKALDIAGIGSDALRRIAGGWPLSHRPGRFARGHRRGPPRGLDAVSSGGHGRNGGHRAPSTISTRWPALARAEGLWFHVDGACGALAMLAPELAPRLKGIERADSLAFDFHKWGQVPYDAGFVLVRDGVLHRQTFATSAPYLRREAPGAGGRLTLALRFRARSFARLSCAEDVVHAQGIRRGGVGRLDRAHLRAGALPGEPHRSRRPSWSWRRRSS